ncbi:MAG: DUF177 domain-containing protein [Bacteroidales bacterium]|nr:DUF177 domain-containing protein [Bacteroidales bacterium]
MSISLNEITSGWKEYNWTVGLEFFQSFENDNILDADIRAKVKVSKVEDGSFLVDLALSGTLTVPCDRCGESVEIACKNKADLVALHCEEDIFEKDGREIIQLEEGARALNLSQEVYDFAILALPLKCCHQKGQCSAKALETLSESRKASKEQDNKPFAALADLIKNSNN